MSSPSFSRLEREVSDRRGGRGRRYVRKEAVIAVGVLLSQDAVLGVERAVVGVQGVRLKSEDLIVPVFVYETASEQ